jgi:hypothetical protein
MKFLRTEPEHKRSGLFHTVMIEFTADLARQPPSRARFSNGKAPKSPSRCVPILVFG